MLRFLSRAPPSSSVWFELGIRGTRGASVQSNSAFWVSVQLVLSGWGAAPGPGSVSGSGPVRSGSDAGELVPEAGRQDALHLLHDEVQRSEQRAEELQRHRNLFDLTSE